ncbi:MAG: T9SS type A sorting domain-containing protein [Edaphocola sp.]
MNKNRTSSIVLGAVFTLLGIGTSHAQTDVTITFVGGTYGGITISESGKIYFNNGNLVYSTDGTNTTTIPLSTIRKLTFESSTPLAVSLLSFTAKKQNSEALLEWATASERNNKYFAIERSADTREWATIGTVESKAENGNSSSLLSYDFTDENPLNGRNYYRLKQVDNDGQYKFSTIQSVFFETANSVKIYPNPTATAIAIETTLDNAAVSVFDMEGRKILSQTMSGTNPTLDISTLPTGNYVLKVDNNGQTFSSKFIKN